MKKMLIAALLTAPALAFAQPPPPPGQGSAWDPGGPGNKERAEKRMRLMEVVGLAEALDLNEADALKLAEKMRAFDERRRPYREQMQDSMKTLRAAADGETAAQGQVDKAVQTILDARAQLAQIDKEMFNTLSQGLTPQKRAQLALFFARGKAMMMLGMGMGHGGKFGGGPGGKKFQDRPFGGEE